MSAHKNEDRNLVLASLLTWVNPRSLVAVLAFPAAVEERRRSCSRQAGNAESRMVTRELLHRDGAQRGCPAQGKHRSMARGLLCVLWPLFCSSLAVCSHIHLFSLPKPITDPDTASICYQNKFSLRSITEPSTACCLPASISILNHIKRPQPLKGKQKYHLHVATNYH